MVQLAIFLIATGYKNIYTHIHTHTHTPLRARSANGVRKNGLVYSASAVLFFEKF